jgi:hypothetical protein
VVLSGEVRDEVHQGPSDARAALIRHHEQVVQEEAQVGVERAWVGAVVRETDEVAGVIDRHGPTEVMVLVDDPAPHTQGLLVGQFALVEFAVALEETQPGEEVLVAQRSYLY